MTKLFAIDPVVFGIYISMLLETPGTKEFHSGRRNGGDIGAVVYDIPGAR